jgi:hypothetical protein
VATCATGGCGQVALDVEKHGARDVALEVGAVTSLGVCEVPAAVDELIAQRRQSTEVPVGRSRRSSRKLPA